MNGTASSARALNLIKRDVGGSLVTSYYEDNLS